MIDYQLLIRQNPWWVNPSSIDDDEKISEFNASKFKFVPKKILDLSESAKAIHVISGPRQTGKSTGLKLKIKELLSSKINPRLIFYYNADAISGRQEAIDLVLTFLDKAPAGHKYIFLDEISSVPNWPMAIKWLADNGDFKNATLFLTGSSSINLKKSGEFLPGRRGMGKNVDFLPLTFHENLEIKGIKIKKIPFGGKNTVARIEKETVFLDKRISSEFNLFLQTGGLIKLINNPRDTTAHQIYHESLRSEIVKNGKNERSARAVIKKLVTSLSSETSYTNVAQEAELGSKNTAIDYLNFFRDSFFLHEALFYDISGEEWVLKKNKKFHFTDPYFLWLLWGYFTGAGVNFSLDKSVFEGNRGPLIENFAASELYKQTGEFYYYKSSRELDFYLPHLKLGIEVKWKDVITSDDLKPLAAARHKILVSKNTLEKRGDIFIIPARLFGFLDFN